MSKIINLISMLVLSFLVSSIGLFRLYSKTEQLEQLMGEEVTDINEILAVINNIQVILYSLQLMYYIMISENCQKLSIVFPGESNIT